MSATPLPPFSIYPLHDDPRLPKLTIKHHHSLQVHQLAGSNVDELEVQDPILILQVILVHNLKAHRFKGLKIGQIITLFTLFLAAVGPLHREQLAEVL